MQLLGKGEAGLAEAASCYFFQGIPKVAMSPGKQLSADGGEQTSACTQCKIPMFKMRL